MYNEEQIRRLVSVVRQNDGIGDKDKLARLVQGEFGLVRERSVFSNGDFSIRFSQSGQSRMSNTVLSLSTLKKFDSRPFFVCIVSPAENTLLLANTTFLKKISHSSQALRVDNIRGSFNGSDILRDYQGLENRPENFSALFACHETFSFEDNLERLVESTNGIVGRPLRFSVTAGSRAAVLRSAARAASFVKSQEYRELQKDLDGRVAAVQEEIALAAAIDNINVRGRVIEYLITDNGSALKKKLIAALRGGKPLPQITTPDGLGDYSRKFDAYRVETDIKSKKMSNEGNPKAYNIDKLLTFLSQDKAVYMIYLLGIDENGGITGRLCSVFDQRLIENTRLLHHWAGRESRGVAQFTGSGLSQILAGGDEARISKERAASFLEELLAR